jgi:hypothetical protein
MRTTIALALCLASASPCLASASPCLAGGEPSRSYYPAPGPYYAPPVIVTAPWPNPIDVLVGGALAIPGVVLGGLFGAIAPPVAVSCVAPDGAFFPCPAGPAPAYPAYPSPTYGPAYGGGYGPQEPLPAPSGYPPPPDPPRPVYGPSGEPRRHSGGGGCYGPDGGWAGDGNEECANLADGTNTP